jgi:hypothetical protein
MVTCSPADPPASWAGRCAMPLNGSGRSRGRGRLRRLEPEHARGHAVFASQAKPHGACTGTSPDLCQRAMNANMPSTKKDMGTMAVALVPERVLQHLSCSEPSVWPG